MAGLQARLGAEPNIVNLIDGAGPNALIAFRQPVLNALIYADNWSASELNINLINDRAPKSGVYVYAETRNELTNTDFENMLVHLVRFCTTCILLVV